MSGSRNTLFGKCRNDFKMKPQFRSLYTVSKVIETKVVIDYTTTLDVIGWFKLQLWTWLAHLTLQ